MEAFGQKFATEVKQKCLSAVFDETFVIGLRNLDKDVFTAGVIRYVFARPIREGATVVLLQARSEVKALIFPSLQIVVHA